AIERPGASARRAPGDGPCRGGALQGDDRRFRPHAGKARRRPSPRRGASRSTGTGHGSAGPIMTGPARSDGDPLVFEGYASRFGVPDLGRDVVERGAFAASLARRGAGGIRMLFQHDAAQPVGTWLLLREDAHGLFVRGRLNAGVARAREIASLIAEGGLDGLSIGFRVR